MMNEVISFDSGEFEIALVTYNRCEFVKEWLERCYWQARQRNIKLSIYDSSTNEDTVEYIDSFNRRMSGSDVDYYHVDPEINIGYKSMLPILNSKSKYVWVAGDSRCLDFATLDKKVFPYLKKNIDYVILHILNNEENDGKIYTNRDELLKDCFLSMTCIGLSIYKTSMFLPLKYDETLRDKCDQKYKMNYGFAWIGYFLEMFSMDEYKALFAIVSITDIKAERKVHTWFKRCYGCWVEDLCNLMDELSEKYHCTESVVKTTWKYQAFDSPGFCDFVRRTGDLDREVFSRYMNNGMLKRVTGHVDRIRMFANAEDTELEECLKRAIEAEEKDFAALCLQKLSAIKELSKGRGIWIYGAGKGGKILRKCMSEQAIPVYGFLDKSANRIKSCEGMPVKDVNDIEVKNSFVVISLLYWKPFVLKPLLDRGIERKNIVYISVDD